MSLNIRGYRLWKGKERERKEEIRGREKKEKSANKTVNLGKDGGYDLITKFTNNINMHTKLIKISYPQNERTPPTPEP